MDILWLFYIDLSSANLVIFLLKRFHENNLGVNMDFATNLRKYRKEKRMSQAELASFLGLSQRTISHYENGSAEPSLQSLYEICNTLQVSADVLLGINLEESQY